MGSSDSDLEGGGRRLDDGATGAVEFLSARACKLEAELDITGRENAKLQKQLAEK